MGKGWELVGRYRAAVVVLSLALQACDTSSSARQTLDAGGAESDQGDAQADGGAGSDSRVADAFQAVHWSPCVPLSAGDFDRSLHHKEARWHRVGIVAGREIGGFLNGPADQARSRVGTKRFGFFEHGGEYVFRAFDQERGRYLTLAGSARGYLDGPFSRARFGGWGYNDIISTACGPEGSLYFLEPHLQVIRKLDFQQRQVTTVYARESGNKLRAITTDPAGVLYATGYGEIIVRVQPDGTVDELSKSGGSASHGFSIAIDPTRQRLYAAIRCAKKGEPYVWYWDLADNGTMHSVLERPAEGEPERELNATGPFAGSHLHCPSGIAFGPEDPDYRYLFYGGGDNTTFFRLDLEQQWIDTFGPIDPDEKTPYTELGWVEAPGKFPFNSIAKWAGTPEWDEGDIYLSNAVWPALVKFQRVQ